MVGGERPVSCGWPCVVWSCCTLATTLPEAWKYDTHTVVLLRAYVTNTQHVRRAAAAATASSSASGRRPDHFLALQLSQAPAVTAAIDRVRGARPSKPLR